MITQAATGSGIRVRVRVVDWTSSWQNSSGAILSIEKNDRVCFMIARTGIVLDRRHAGADAAPPTRSRTVVSSTQAVRPA